MKFHLAALCSTIAAVIAASAPGFGSNGILALVENVDDDKYSAFFDSLSHRGHELTVKQIKDEDWSLMQQDERSFDHLIIFPTTKAKNLGSRLNSASLLKYFENGGNILAVTNSKSSPDSLREFAGELDIHISPRGYRVADNFDQQYRANKLLDIDLSKSTDPDAHFIIDDVPGSSSTSSSSSLSYDGNGAYLGNSQLLIPILHASDTSYVFDSRDEANEVADSLWATGSQVSLCAGLQNRNNARFAWIGSDVPFTNAGANAAATQFISDLTKWTFQEKRVIQVDYVRHYNRDNRTLSNPQIYKVSEYAGYEIALREWQGSKWIPFSTKDDGGADVQLEFVMLDPYYRITLKRDLVKSSDEYAVYSTEFQLPDQYGMFTFRVNYMRPGLSFIDQSHTVTVRHTANDEWPRSWQISNSWVYLTSAGCVVSSFLVFVVMYLYTGAPEKETKKNE